MPKLVKQFSSKQGSFLLGCAAVMKIHILMLKHTLKDQVLSNNQIDISTAIIVPFQNVLKRDPSFEFRGTPQTL